MVLNLKIIKTKMDRNNSHLTLGFRYNPLLPPAHTVFVTDRDRYPYSTMTAERSGYLSPCYWPSPYNGPYGVSAQHSAPVNTAKISGINSCECSVCVTTTSQTFKPVFAHSTDSLVKNQTVSQVQSFTGQKETPNNRDSPNVQNYHNKGRWNDM